MPDATPNSNLAVEIASGDALDLREFHIDEAISSLFEVRLVALSDNPDIDFDAVVGQPASFSILADPESLTAPRRWTGICNRFRQTAVEEDGLSTYELTLVPTLWLATQRRNYRMFQQISEPDIVLQILSEWSIKPEVRLVGDYKKRKYRVQYGESDYAFLCRMLEDAGISFYFAEADGETRLILSDVPHANESRAAKLPFRDHPTVADREYVTRVQVGKQVRPGRYTMRDQDYRRPPAHQPMASTAAPDVPVEARLERYHYTPGAFLFGTNKGEDTPVADDRGKTRTDEAEATLLTQKRLEAKRASARVCTFETNAHDLAPGVVVSLLDHPRADLGPDKRLLLVSSTLSGRVNEQWSHACEARSAEYPYRPPLKTPKPKVSGVESATVVGPVGEEIHTDEFGRVRVHFHWDRESRMDDKSSCWIPVTQAWAGTGYGGVNLPRVGQEVIVDFLGGDPDRPIIVGRVFTGLQKVPYNLPANKTQSGLKSSSTGGTGGYNEIMFEDTGGREFMRIQAERDMNKLVKNDETATIGNDRTKAVKRNDALTVGSDLWKTVGRNAREVVGANQSMTVGGNRTTRIGVNDVINVGAYYKLEVLPPDGFDELNGRGGRSKHPETTTYFEMKHDYIRLSTASGASITLHGKQIEISAAASISATGNGISLTSSKGDFNIQGGPNVHINPPPPPHWQQ